MNVSEKFTIEDIHNIRFENYEETKHLTPQELINKTNESASRVVQRINQIREEKLNKN